MNTIIKIPSHDDEELRGSSLYTDDVKTYFLQHAEDLLFPWWSAWFAAKSCPIPSHVYSGSREIVENLEGSPQIRVQLSLILRW